MNEVQLVQAARSLREQHGIPEGIAPTPDEAVELESLLERAARRQPFLNALLDLFLRTPERAAWLQSIIEKGESLTSPPNERSVASSYLAPPGAVLASATQSYRCSRHGCSWIGMRQSSVDP